jgi:hypothetical protein
VGPLVLHLSLVSLDSDGLSSSLDLESPSLDLSLVATAALLGASDGDSDWLAGSLASGDSVSVNVDLGLNNNLSSLFSGLDEFGSDLVAVARLVSDDDLSGLLAGLELVSEDNNLVLNLGLLLSSDGDFDLLGSLDLSSPFLDRLSAAVAWLLDMVDSDGDLTSSLASSDSVAIQSNVLIGNQYLFSSGLNIDSVLQGFAATSFNRGLLHDHCAGFSAGFSVESLSLNKLSMCLSCSVALNSVDSSVVDSVFILNGLASALLVSNDDVFSSLSADSGSSSPSSGKLLVLSDVLSLVLNSDGIFLSSDLEDLTSPSVDFVQGAFAWLLVDSDDFASL